MGDSTSRTSGRTRKALVVGAVGLGLVLAPTLSSAKPGGQPRYSAGAPGAGDPYFPFAGNGGYDVGHYDLDLTYTPPAPAPAPLVGQLDGVATIELTADPGPGPVQPRPARAGGQPGHRRRQAGRGGRRRRRPAPRWMGRPSGTSRTTRERKWELTVQPRPKIKAGRTVEVVVEYGGPSTRPRDIEDALYGWVTTRDGAMVVNEPDGAMTWYPVSDHPTDKATYDFEITVPTGKVAVANGLPAREPTPAGRLDDLVLGRPRRAGELPVHGLGRRLRAPGVRPPPVASRSSTPSTTA